VKSKKNIKVIIAGYGVVGKKRHAALNRLDNIEVVAICDRTFQNVKTLKDNTIYFQNYEDGIKVEADAIFLCLTNDIAAKATMKCIDIGLHVFCEKPPGINLKEIYDIYKLTKNNKKQSLMYGFNHRYHDSIERALKIIKSKKYGDIININGLYGKSNVVTFDQTDWRTKRSVAGGGILLDQGVHMLDLFTLIAGEFKEIKSIISNNYWKFDVEDNVYAIMRNKYGTVATINSSATQWPHTFYLEINLSKVNIILSGILSGSKSYGDETLKIINKETKKVINCNYSYDNSWDKEVKLFINSIKSNKSKIINNSSDAFKTMKLLFSIYYADFTWRKKYNIKNPNYYSL